MYSEFFKYLLEIKLSITHNKNYNLRNIITAIKNIIFTCLNSITHYLI